VLREPRCESHIEAEALRRSFHTVIRGFGMLDSATTPCGQPMPISLAHALMELLARSTIRQGDLAAALGLSKSATSRLVGQMERRRWVERAIDETDRRAWRVGLNATGKRVAEQVNAASLRRFTAMLEGIPCDKREAIYRSLDVLSQAISASTQSGGQ